MKAILTIILIVFGSFNLFAQSKITKEEYKVYSKVFESIYEKRKVPLTFQIVILDKTVKQTLNSGSPEKRSKEYFSGSKNPFYKDFGQARIEELLKDYNEKNATPAIIEKRIKTKYNYAIISQYQLNKLLIVGRKLYNEMPEKPVTDLHSPMIIWKPFISQYRTDGCYSLSRVAFSKDEKLALVLVSNTDGISGEDKFFILEKKDHLWLNPQWFGNGIGWII